MKDEKKDNDILSFIYNVNYGIAVSSLLGLITLMIVFDIESLNKNKWGIFIFCALGLVSLLCSICFILVDVFSYYKTKNTVNDKFYK